LLAAARSAFAEAYLAFAVISAVLMIVAAAVLVSVAARDQLARSPTLATRS
jgi:hypothetical protein